MLEKIKIVAAGAIFMCLLAAFVFEEWRISRQHQVVPLGTVSETAIQTSASSYCKNIPPIVQPNLCRITKDGPMIFGANI
jgi:hypothetical protein